MFNTIKACNDRLAELGHKRSVFSNLKAAQAAVARAESGVNKPSSKPVSTKPVATKTTSAREKLLADIEATNEPGKKADLYGKLSESLLQEMNAEKDLVRQTELRRQFQRSETNRAYCLQAEKQLNPQAAKARKLMRLLE
jgi:hypothetical protein